MTGFGVSKTSVRPRIQQLLEFLLSPRAYVQRSSIDASNRLGCHSLAGLRQETASSADRLVPSLPHQMRSSSSSRSSWILLSTRTPDASWAADRRYLFGIVIVIARSGHRPLYLRRCRGLQLSMDRVDHYPDCVIVPFDFVSSRQAASSIRKLVRFLA